MNNYTPDRWVVLEITSKKLGTTIRKVFAGWYGGFLDGDSWKLNSGITNIRINEGLYEFDGQSGSTYHCYIDTHGMSSYMFSALTNWRTKYPDIEFKEIDLESIVVS